MALEDNNFSILKFCLWSVSRDCSFFEFVIHQFTVTFCSANTTPLVQQSPQSLWEEMSVAAGPGDAQWIRDRWNEYSPRLTRTEVVSWTVQAVCVWGTKLWLPLQSAPNPSAWCSWGSVPGNNQTAVQCTSFHSQVDWHWLYYSLVFLNNRTLSAPVNQYQPSSVLNGANFEINVASV